MVFIVLAATDQEEQMWGVGSGHMGHPRTVFTAPLSSDKTEAK